MSFGADSTEVTCLKMCYFHKLPSTDRSAAWACNVFSVSLFLYLAIGIGNGTRDERKGKNRRSEEVGEKVLICMKSVSLLPRSNRPLLCRRTSLSFVSASSSTHYFIPISPETSLQSSQCHPVTSFLSRGRRFSKLNFLRLLEYSLFRSHGCKLCMSGYFGYPAIC